MKLCVSFVCLLVTCLLVSCTDAADPSKINPETGRKIQASAAAVGDWIPSWAHVINTFASAVVAGGAVAAVDRRGGKKK